MRLYATVQNERAGRAVKKGGNEFLQINIDNGNYRLATIYIDAGDGGIELHGVNGVIKKFTPFDLGHK